MSWKQEKSKRRYHHGNLREALIEAALALMGSKGPQGFTFAEAAREAGVSAAAPYRHFRDRDELVQEVARRGFEKLAGRLTKAASVKGAPLEKLLAICAAYLEFANRQTPLFSAMYESGLSVSSDRALKAESDKCFEIFKGVCEAICADTDAARRPPVMMVALHIWSLTHGHAALFARGDDARRALPMPVNDLLEAAVLIYLDGLGISR